MEKSKVLVPSTVANFVKSKQYAEALNQCKKEKFNDSPILQRINEEIFRAKELFDKSDFSASIACYISLIGVYDPYIVVSKFFKPDLENFLEDFLIELHKRGYGTTKLTRLLFYMLIQPQSIEKLKRFVGLIETAQRMKRGSPQQPKKQPEFNYQRFLRHFDVDVAIDVLAKNGFEDEAKRITNAVGVSIHMISSMIFQQKNYIEAATHMFDHYDEPIGYSMLMKFGPIILKNDSDASKIIEQTAAMMWRVSKSDNEQDFIKLFWGYPQHMARFLKNVISEKPTNKFVTLYLELLIPRPNAGPDSFFGNNNISNPDLAVSIIIDKKLSYDCEHIISVCTECSFIKGLIHVLSKIGRNHDALEFLLRNPLKLNDVIDWYMNEDCKLNGHDSGVVFIHSINEISQSANFKLPINTVPFFQKLITNMLDIRSIGWILTELQKVPALPVLVLQKASIIEELKKIEDLSQPVCRDFCELEKELIRIKKEENLLKTSESSFRPTKCAKCNEILYVPYKCFFCQHIFHIQCLPIDDQDRCPICCIPTKQDTLNLEAKSIDNVLIRSASSIIGTL